MASENFTILDGELISYNGDSANVVVPDGVKIIMEGAFLGCTKIETLVLPEGVGRICRKAFWGCVGLRSIKLPSSLRAIEFCAFRECEALEEIDFPEGLQFLGDSVFRSCTSLEKVCLPDSLTEMGTSTFSECFRLSQVKLPNRMDSLPCGTFHSCISLRSVHIPDSFKILDKNAFLGCSALTEVRLPDGLRSIERQCFEGCRRLNVLDVPDCVELIGGNAFYKSGIMNNCRGDFLILGKILVKYMGNGENAVVPDGVRVVGERAFAYNDALRTVALPDTVTEVRDYAFERCVCLENVSFPEGLKRLGKGVFTDCKSFSQIDLPPHLDNIGANLFYGSALESVHGEELVVLAGKYLISYRGSAEKAPVPEGIEVIADEAFVSCGGIKEVILPYGLRTIGCGAFRWRSELKRITIPSTVNYIGENAFVNCHEPEITIMNPCGILGENGIPDGTHLRVVVGSRVLKVRLTWEVKAGDCPERRLWNFVCVRSAATFAVLQKPEYKLACAICFYDDGKWYSDYIKKHIVEAVCCAAISEDGSMLERVLSFGLLDRTQLQSCIDFATEHKLTWQQVVLMKFRHENFGE